MNRVDRLFGIVTLLQSKKYVPAEQIAERYNISVRTVYRDIKALCEQGLPVSFEQGRGYFMVQGYFLPPVSFTPEEANAMLLMETLVQGFGDRSIQQHYGSALSKIKSVMRGGQKDSLERLTETMKLQIPQCVVPNYGYLTTLQNAISNRHIIELSYTRQDGEASTRRVEAIGLIFYAFSWHLIAWCHLRGDYRDFRVSRITAVRDTGRAFEKSDHLPLSEYMKDLPVDY